jgi:hypothetical protein
MPRSGAASKTVRGNFHTSGDGLPENDIRDLADLLASQLYNRMERKVYGLSRQDIAELVTPYVEDLTQEDRISLAWLIWDLFQEGLKIERQQRPR